VCVVDMFGKPEFTAQARHIGGSPHYLCVSTQYNYS